jgi:peptide-methionine (R)-S-oxide reductase
MKVIRPIILFLSFIVLAAVLSGGNAATDPGASETVRIFDVSKGGYAEVEKIQKTDKEWKDILIPEQFHVLRKHGTERPFTSELNDNKKKGIYKCAACGTDLFSSEAKFDSGTGWPSFFGPVAEENIGTTVDNSLFMQRTEEHCARCGGHLGHIFDDGPPPTGKRHCINGVALKFVEKE